MGSAQSARGIQLGGLGAAARCGRIPSTGPLPGAGRPPPGAFPPLVVRRDRLWVGLEGLGGEGGPRLRPRALQRPPARTSPLPGAVDSVLAAPSLPRALLTGGACWEGRGPSLPARLPTGADCPQCAPTASRRQGGDRPTLPKGRQGSAAMSATHPTRLVTRTKESDMRASRRVLKPGMRKEADEREALTGRTAGRP